MSWGLGSWKRQVDTFHLILGYGQQESIADSQQSTPRKGPDLKASLPSASDLASGCKYRVHVDWSAGDDEDQVVLKLQSQLMVTLPAPHDEVQVQLVVNDLPDGQDVEYSVPDYLGDIFTDSKCVSVTLRAHKRREPLKVLSMSRTAGSGPSSDGLGVVARILDPGSPEKTSHVSVTEELLGSSQHWRSLTVLNLCSCSLAVSLKPMSS